MASEKAKILIVDDDKTVPAIIEKSRLMAGYQIVSTNRSVEVVDLCKLENPHLILLDYNMPEVNGIELCKRLKQNKELKDIPVIFITAMSDTKDMVIGFKAGASDYVTKPIDFEELAIRIERRLDLYYSRIKIKDYAAHMEELAEERAKQLMHADRLATIGTLSAGLAHEIKNPSTFISGNAQTLERFWSVMKDVIEESLKGGHEDEAQLEFILEEMPNLIEGIRDGVSRISNVVDSLKAYSRKETVDKKPFHIVDCVENAVMLCQKIIKKNITIEKKIPKEDSVVIGDAQQIEQVLINLLVNASDAMEKTENAKILINVNNSGNKVTLSVEDNGPGISEEKFAKIWEPFFTTKPAGKGTGLGLPICRSIVDGHGGELNAENCKNGGLRFDIILPLSK